jgi:hypothetical protein
LRLAWIVQKYSRIPKERPMSLRAQLVRGYLALPLLAGLAVLAWQAHAQPAPGASAIAVVRVAVLAPATPGHAICRLGPAGLRLALAPADLQPQSRRRDATCRA